MKIAVERKKIGIIGGSFDPIHNGHLKTAEVVYEKLGLEKIIFVPAYVAPHKIGMEFAKADDRYAMTELAVQKNTHFSVSDIEFSRGGISYTYDTIQALHKKFGADFELYFVIGADSVAELDTWHKVREIMEICTFVAATRPGVASTVEKVIKYFGELGANKIKWLDTPEMDISSTDIRQRIQRGASIEELVPAEVAEYIYQKGLYRL
ncbi:MAG TPA: nicotinate-nucleotide adenylyltransferase [Candidatus Avacidaminococcus intestinavium]|uniref:Probable nicotinate-nucleotide adenylyltransferase n=1 Tax=Candidatus Avacidaminococcus intestinavium TaxID=2840684 RepID=A0A9D1MQW4_9FIRM|nr:nicotinate-nucleotide adenylyltransferase [Candidatus Avacidaminococcus intestinavium]